MKNYLFIVWSLLLCVNSSYSMDNEISNRKEKTRKEELYIHVKNMQNLTIFTKVLDLSNTDFGKRAFPLNTIIDGFPLLETCDISRTNIATIDLSFSNSRRSTLSFLNASHNVLQTFNLAALLDKCDNVQEINLENNILLHTIVSENKDFCSCSYLFYPTINLKKTALTLENKKLLCDKYAQYDKVNNLCISFVTGAIATLCVGVPMTAMELAEPTSPLQLFPLLCGIMLGRYIDQKLCKAAQQQIREKIIF